MEDEGNNEVEGILEVFRLLGGSEAVADAVHRVPVILIDQLPSLCWCEELIRHGHNQQVDGDSSEVERRLVVIRPCSRSSLPRVPRDGYQNEEEYWDVFLYLPRLVFRYHQCSGDDPEEDEDHNTDARISAGFLRSRNPRNPLAQVQGYMDTELGQYHLPLPHLPRLTGGLRVQGASGGNSVEEHISEAKSLSLGEDRP